MSEALEVVVGSSVQAAQTRLLNTLIPAPARASQSSNRPAPDFRRLFLSLLSRFPYPQLSRRIEDRGCARPSNNCNVLAQCLLNRALEWQGVESDHGRFRRARSQGSRSAVCRCILWSLSAVLQHIHETTADR